MNWQESAIKQQERLLLVSKIEDRLSNLHGDKTKYIKKKSSEADSPRHLREAELAVAIKIKHPQLCRKNNNSWKHTTESLHTHTHKHTLKKTPIKTVKWLLSSVLRSFRALKFEPAARLFLLYYTEHNSCVMESRMSVGQQNNFTVKSDLLRDIICSICEAVGLTEDWEVDGCLNEFLEFRCCDPERQDTHNGLRVLLELLLIIALVRLL